MSANEAMATGPSSGRLLSIDVMRGFIIALMALDHASFFIAKRHASEYWGVGLPVFPDGFSFVTRLVTHLCAPGFFFLMGVGMTLFAVKRRDTGMPQKRIRRYFVVRGLLILLIQQVLENPAWGVGILTGGGAQNYGVKLPPGTATGFPYLSLTVLFGLGTALLTCAFVLAWRTWLVIAVCVGSVLVTAFFLPDPSNVNVAHSPLLRVLLIPGITGRFSVLYPLVPWLAPTCLGIVFGRILLRDNRAAMRLAMKLGCAFLLAFVALRSMSGFGNLHAPATGAWMDFFNLTKYPPSLVFLLLTLGVDLVLLAVLSRVARSSWLRPLRAFGRAPLFFYLAHLWLLAVLGALLVTGLVWMYVVWLGVCAALWPACSAYGRFKASRSSDSFWRLL